MFGILSDVSERGMRIHSDRILARGQRVALGVRFPARPELFEAQGRVRWSRPAFRGEDGMNGGGLAGLELSPGSPAALATLRRVLISADFENPESGSQQFEQFLLALRPFLLRLGSLMDEAARSDPSS